MTYANRRQYEAARREREIKDLRTNAVLENLISRGIIREDEVETFAAAIQKGLANV